MALVTPIPIPEHSTVSPVLGLAIKTNGDEQLVRRMSVAKRGFFISQAPSSVTAIVRVV